MATLASAITAQGYQEATLGGSPSYMMTVRVAFDTAYDISTSAGLQHVKSIATGQTMQLLGTGSDANELGRMRLRSITVNPVPGSQSKIFDCTMRYDTLYAWAYLAAVGAYTSTLVLPVEVSVESSPRSVSMHRSPAFGTAPAADTSTTTDIGGTKVDYAGRPVPAQIAGVRFNVSLVFDVSRTTLVSVYDRVASHAGKWNSAAFMHWASANQVWCESANVSHIRDEFYRASYVFVWDQWFGAEQTPKTDVNGNASVDSNGSSNLVTWKNIVRGSIDHNLIFNDAPNATLAKQIALEGSWLTYP